LNRLPLRLGVVYDFRNQPGGPPLWIAAMSASGAARAARFDANLLPQGERAQVLDPWREAVRAAGRSPEHGLTDLVTWAVPPGLRPEQMNRSLERFAREVAPRLRARRSVV
jgi:hypothetical protein